MGRFTPSVFNTRAARFSTVRSVIPLVYHISYLSPVLTTLGAATLLHGLPLGLLLLPTRSGVVFTTQFIPLFEVA
ncbi:hypothetical protein ES703_65525 [subsurface metagenome]